MSTYPFKFMVSYFSVMFNKLITKEMQTLELELEHLIPKNPREVYALLPPYIKLGGKRIRPALSILTCLSLNGSVKDVIKPAAILELFHNFTLIHDDIEDNSLLRRGEPTLHISHGLPIALNSGDALYTALWDALVSLDLDPAVLIRLQKLYVSVFKRVVDGQGIELNWYRDNNFGVSEEDYLFMVRGKTASLIGLSCVIGAFIAKKDEPIQRKMQEFGENLGLAFQIQDDVLNLIGNLEEYKKEIGGDITEGKRTLIVVHAFKHTIKKDKDFLISCLKNHTSNQDDIKRCVKILSDCGSIEYARKKAMSFVELAKKSLDVIPHSPFKDELLKLSDFVVSRKS